MMQRRMSAIRRPRPSGRQGVAFQLGHASVGTPFHRCLLGFRGRARVRIGELAILLLPLSAHEPLLGGWRVNNGIGRRRASSGKERRARAGREGKRGTDGAWLCVRVLVPLHHLTLILPEGVPHSSEFGLCGSKWI